MFIKKMKRLIISGFIVFLSVFTLCTAFAAERQKDPITLKILYFNWDPGTAVARVASKYEEATKGKIKAETELPTLTEFYEKWLSALKTKKYMWDIIVIDSQWLGMGVDAGALADITDLIGNKPFLKGIPSNLKEAYMSDPTFRGRIWSVPLQYGVEGLVYRKDLFDDPDYKAEFENSYGYELDVPDTWFQLRDIAEFFHDPENNFYGFITKWGKTYDTITWDFNQVLWDFGGDFWDPKTLRAEGYINSPQAIKAMRFYKSLTQFAPPGWENAAFAETVQSMSQGLVAMAIEWFAFCPAIVDPKQSEVYDKVGFATIPRGPAGQYISLGGQPMTISAYSPHKKEAADFIEWFYKPDQLWIFAEGHGFPPFDEIAGTERFWKILPQNEMEWKSSGYARDIWTIAPYDDLVQASQELLNQAVTGAKPIKDALDELAAKHQKILDDYKEKLNKR
jgi:multiple sugar transport system substrate-binding protein